MDDLKVKCEVDGFGWVGELGSPSIWVEIWVG